MPHHIGAQVARFYEHLCDPMGKKEGTPPQSLMGSPRSSASSGLSTVSSVNGRRRNAFELISVSELSTAAMLRTQLPDSPSYRELAAKKLTKKYSKKVPVPMAKLAAKAQVLFRFGYGKRAEERLSQVNTSTASRQTRQQIEQEHIARMAALRAARENEQRLDQA